MLILEDKQCEFRFSFFFTIEAVYTPNYQLHKAVAWAMAYGFEEVKPELQATPSPATASQSLASEGSAWAGLRLSGRAGTSLRWSSQMGSRKGS